MHRFGHPWLYGHHWGGGFLWWPGMLLTVLSTLFLIALFVGLAVALLRWIMPSIRPMLTGWFGVPTANPSALEILRRRYAAGEISTDTFEQMWERLVASYRQISNGMPRDEYGPREENWLEYRGIYHSPASYGQGRVRMAEQEQYQEQYMSETDM